MKTEKWVVLPDTQWPYHDERTVNAVLRYVAENTFDGLLQLGDFMDWGFISRWTKDNARAIEGNRFLKEYEGANKFLDQIVDSVRANNKKAQIVILEGNHDWRVENVIDKDPKLEGLIEMEKNLRFKERGVYFHRYWTHRKPYQIGKALFIHGEYTNDHHAKKTALAFGQPVYYGHTHDHQLYSRVMRGDDKTVTAESLGCLCRYDMPDYMEHRPNNWQQGFAVFYFRPNGYFNHFFIDIFNHSFTSPEGKEYKG